MGLDVAVVLSGRGEDVLEDVAGRSKSFRQLLGVQRHGPTPLDVGVRHPRTLAFEIDVAVRLGMQDGRVRRQRVLRREDRRQLLVLDVDQSGRLLGELTRIRCDRGDPFADEPNDASRQHGLVEQHAAESDPAEVGSGENGSHAGEVPGRRRVHTDQAGMGVVAAPEGGPQHPGTTDIGGVGRRAGDLVAPVDPVLRLGQHPWRLAPLDLRVAHG